VNKFIIAVGSQRGPKLDAVRDAVEQIAHLLGSAAEFQVRGFDVDSGVGHTPLSSGESMRGAQQRAEALMRIPQAATETFRYFVGLEGGLEVITSDQKLNENMRRRVFLESWAYVSDGVRGHFGRSGAIELPASLAVEVLDHRVELAAAIDKFAGRAGIRDSNGAWGVLSADLISRREAFRVALIAAFAPFYNAALYRMATAAG
jgi:inosine/xanthosine triphosphatase